LRSVRSANTAFRSQHSLARIQIAVPVQHELAARGGDSGCRGACTPSTGSAPGREACRWLSGELYKQVTTSIDCQRTPAHIEIGVSFSAVRWDTQQTTESAFRQSAHPPSAAAYSHSRRLSTPFESDDMAFDRRNTQYRSAPLLVATPRRYKICAPDANQLRTTHGIDPRKLNQSAFVSSQICRP
jgi:hypothetical protein